MRLNLPPRYLEPVLQALVRCGLLKGVTGPRGGYQLARARENITLTEIVVCAQSIERYDEPVLIASKLIKEVVLPSVAQAESKFYKSLSRVTVADLVRAIS